MNWEFVHWVAGAAQVFAIVITHLFVRAVRRRAIEVQAAATSLTRKANDVVHVRRSLMEERASLADERATVERRRVELIAFKCGPNCLNEPPF